LPLGASSDSALHDIGQMPSATHTETNTHRGQDEAQDTMGIGSRTRLRSSGGLTKGQFTNTRGLGFPTSKPTVLSKSDTGYTTTIHSTARPKGAATVISNDIPSFHGPSSTSQDLIGDIVPEIVVNIDDLDFIEMEDSDAISTPLQFFA